MLRHSVSDFAVIVMINIRYRKVRPSSPQLFLFTRESQEGRKPFNSAEGIVFHFTLW